MNISPFFRHLRSAYQSELDDLTSDSEGKDVLRKRLAEKRKEIDFLIQMMALSPEMVAVIFHQGFQFKLPAVMDDLLSFESDELPDWDRLEGVITLTPWARDLANIVLKQPQGEWFMTVAAALEYMYSKPDGRPATQHGDDEEEDDKHGHKHDGENDDDVDGNADNHSEFNDEDDKEAKAHEKAGSDWMVEQGFDRKD